MSSINFLNLTPASYVRRTLLIAFNLTSGKPVDSRAILEGILKQRGTESPSYELIQRLFPDFKDTEDKTIGIGPESVLKSYPVSGSLYESYTRAEKLLRQEKNFWGRDLIMLILLVHDDKDLELFLLERGVKLDDLRRAWFEFLMASHDDHRGPEGWRVWWRDAGLLVPGEAPNNVMADISSSADTGPMEEEEPPEVFIVYKEIDNEKVRLINEAIRSWGISTYFWGRDMRYGDNWLEKEFRVLRGAKTVLVFLGENGWGTFHLQLTQEAQRLNKRIIPVLLGTLRADFRRQANGLFVQVRYVEMAMINDQSLADLRRSLEQVENKDANDPRQEDGFDALVLKIMDGEEEERLAVLNQIARAKNYNRTVLSARLRREIERFEPSSEKELSRAARPVDRIPSIRSWLLSCLIQCDAVGSENRQVLLRHVSSEFETQEHVKYWVLSGLYQKNVPYLAEAAKIAGEDHRHASIAFLGFGILAPQLEFFLSRLREYLTSKDKEKILRALRVLRVLPVESVVEDVCNVLRRLDDRVLEYDAFYALVNPGVIQKATRSLAEDPGITVVVHRLASILFDARDMTRVNLTRILVDFDRKAVDGALLEIIAQGEYAIVATHVRLILKDFYQDLDDVEEVSHAGIYGDFNEDAEDLLDITRDVKTLTSVILAKNTPLPLAIGLFGDWGHGKSFFMGAVRKEISEAHRYYSPKAFHTHVVPIEFNAWHYADTSLWASLVNHILVQLLKFVSPEATDEEKQQAILNKISTTKSQIGEAIQAKQTVSNALVDKQGELEAAKKQRQEKEVELKNLRLKDVYDVLTSGQKEEIERIADRLGFPAVIESFSDLRRLATEASSTTGKVRSLVKSILESRDKFWLILAFVFVFFAVPILIDFITTKDAENAFIARFGAKVAQFVAGICTVYGVVRKGLDKFHAGVSQLESIKNNAQHIFDRQRSQPSAAEEGIQREIIDLQARETAVAQEISSKEKELADLEEKIRILKEERSLNRFLTTRTQSEDYRKHLGIISVIREDFTSLTQKLANAYKDEPGAGYRRVDRIVLYIDDLDRCPVDKVMEVLQAVHLLLAFKLFVVIVGVDPRWLLHSLGSQFSAFQNAGKNFGGDKATADWLTTPQHFLEKIFQIQFCLSPMTSEGYTTMMGNLFKNTDGRGNGDGVKEDADSFGAGASDEAGSGDAETKGTSSPSAERVTDRDAERPKEKDPGVEADTREENTTNSNTTDQRNSDQGNADPQDANGRRAGNKDPDSDNARIGSTHAENKEKYTIDEESMRIHAWEIGFSGQLYEFIASPRAATRFSNAYRLLKAGVPKANLQAFEGQAELPGEFQAPMLLLALMSGATEQALKFFPTIRRELREKALQTIIDELLAEKDIDNSYRVFLVKVKRVVSLSNFPDDSALVLYWIPRVARFSFDLSRILKGDSVRV
ncbi:TIR domain-containing protein [Fulvivirgaceae bacterium PWU5]|uniref:TIR domain-containing protein n=1 Tax=Dawidia cretensis TaxID=2782350 RepID=A0AAP2E297_9BACT|nr:P-loop NTPase fold protein [Dawidia cretensis]MBT1710739.1 TIR domain-containing protein [Dawidia cretensis]